ncbi:MAG TPA: hypothetical protein VGK17_16765 [Propionicimonas sp.]|jgi:hypothetical protein
MTSYQITPADTGVTVELTGVGDQHLRLLAAFGDCQSGQCSCPTTEYEKVDGMEVTPSGGSIAIALRAKPGTQFDIDQIAACLDYTVDQSSAELATGLGAVPGE